MNLPYPPTDNLYKFMAIAGVLIFLLSWWPLYLLYDIGRQRIALKGDIDVIKIEARYVEALLENVKDELWWERLRDDDTTPGETESKEKERPVDQIKRMYARTEEVSARNRDVEIKNRQLTAKLDTLEYLSRVYEPLRILALIGMFASITLAYVGFKFWYTRVQKHLDREYQAKGQIQPKRVAKRQRQTRRKVVKRRA